MSPAFPASHSYMSKISTTLRGSIFGILGAAAYGTNPLFALPQIGRAHV